VVGAPKPDAVPGPPILRFNYFG